MLTKNHVLRLSTASYEANTTRKRWYSRFMTPTSLRTNLLFQTLPLQTQKPDHRTSYFIFLDPRLSSAPVFTQPTRESSWHTTGKGSGTSYGLATASLQRLPVDFTGTSSPGSTPAIEYRGARVGGVEVDRGAMALKEDAEAVEVSFDVLVASETGAAEVLVPFFFLSS